MGYSIAVFGAFNVYSFGDTMFPEALRREMSKHLEIDSVTLFSLGGAVSGYYGKQEICSYEEFPLRNQKQRFDAIVIGGGELLHNHEISFAESGIVYSPGEIWKKPVEYGIEYQIPVLLNSVGMPYEFKEEERAELEKLCGYISYVSLRDVYSYSRWKHFWGGAYPARLVPDSLWCMEDYFSREELEKSRQGLKEKYGIEKAYMILQYGTTHLCRAAVYQAGKFAENHGLQLVMLEINASHEDRYVVEHTEAAGNLVVIKEILTPKEIAAMISGAVLFVGTSLHGTITAAAFGIKYVMIDMYPGFVSKMDGLCETLEASGAFVGDMQDFWFVLNQVYDCRREDRERITRLKERTQAHFAEMCRIIESGAAPEAAAETVLEPAGGELFRKGYFKLSDSAGVRQIFKAVAERKEGGYTFSLGKAEAEGTDCVSFCMAADSPVQVCFDEGAELLYEEDLPKSGIYIKPVLEWKLKKAESYVLRCGCQPADIQMRGTEIWNFYRNLYMETETLIFRERELSGELAEAVQRTGGYAAQKEGLAGEENARLQAELLEKKNHMEQLLSAERELAAIKQSKMFRAGRFCCRILDGILSAPKFLGKQITAFIRMMGHVNPTELKIAWGYVCREGIPGAYRHLMRDYHQGMEKKLPVEVEKEVFQEITELSACEQLTLPQTEHPEVSIVIPAYNQFTYTYYCLKSIIENSGDVPYEVILADDCSNDLTTEISKVVDHLVIARTEKNQLFLRNCNHAAKYVRGKYILFLNNDTQVQENWLRPLTELMERDGSIGMTGSKLVYSDGTLQEAGGIIWKDASGWNYGRNDNALKPEYNYVKEADYISGASIMIRRNLWEQLGGFDELFAPAYYEDADLAFQVRAAGYKVVYQPLSVVVHFEGKSNGTDLSSGVKQYQVENHVKFRNKWRAVLEKENLPNAQDVYLAKDRGQLKKQILVVDHYVPHYDKDAGGRCTYMYLKLFLKFGFKVTFIGDNFYPHEPYTTELKQMGIEVLYGDYYYQHHQEWLRDNLRYFDYIYLQRPHISIKYIDLVKQYGKGKIFYFAHDLHFLRLSREYELKHDPKILEEAEKFKKDEFYLFRQADVVHVVGSYEQAVLKKELPGKTVRNIPLYIYEQLLTDINKDFSTRKDLVFVGGFGHTPNIDAVTWFAKEVYPRVLEAYPDMIWHIVGGNPPDEVKTLADDHIVLEGFLSDEDLEKMYRNCRLAVVPLRVGAGVKGKVVEAAYYQIPLVTTSIGEEGISAEEGAFIAEDDAGKMAELIISLYGDFERLRKMSDSGMELIRNHYMLDEAERVLKLDL